MSTEQIQQGQQFKKFTDGRRQFLLTMIETAGFKEQNEKLIAEGFNQLKKNLKLLVKNNGNVEATIEQLKKKILKKQEHKQKHQHIEGEQKDKPKNKELALNWIKKHLPPKEETEKQIKELGFEEANKQLVDQGFHRIFINLRVLKRFNGDAEKSAAFMTEVKAKVQQFVQEKRKHQDPEFPQLKEQFNAKLQKFHDAGFNNHKRILKALAFYNGDVDRAINSMNKVREWKRSIKQTAKQLIKTEEVKE